MASDGKFVTELIVEVDRLKTQKEEERKEIAFEESCAWHEHGKNSGCKGIRWKKGSFRTG